MLEIQQGRNEVVNKEQLWIKENDYGSSIEKKKGHGTKSLELNGI